MRGGPEAWRGGAGPKAFRRRSHCTVRPKFGRFGGAEAASVTYTRRNGGSAAHLVYFQFSSLAFITMDSDSDEELLLLLALSQKNNKKKREWVHDINKKREKYGEYHHICTHIHNASSSPPPRLRTAPRRSAQSDILL